MANKYIASNGMIKRFSIVDDVVRGILTKYDIEELCNDPEIIPFLVKRKFKERINPDQWDERYLKRLSDDAITKGFDCRYLVHISDVGRYIRTNYLNSRAKDINTLKSAAELVGLLTLFGIIAFWKTR